MSKYSKMIEQIINESHDHMTAEQIFSCLRQTEHASNIVLATVYNNLNRLVGEGKIRRITLPNLPDHYDRVMKHDHLICPKCGKIKDVHLADFTSQIEASVGRAIASYDLTAYMICDECKH